MKAEIQKATDEFVSKLTQIMSGTTGGKPRGMATLSAEARSLVAKKAAATRKRRAAARKAAETRKANAR